MIFLTVYRVSVWLSPKSGKAISLGLGLVLCDYGEASPISRLLNVGTESAEVTEFRSLFHCGMVLATKCCWRSVVLHLGTWSLSLVTRPLEARWFFRIPRLSGVTATSSCRILYKNTNLATLRRSSSVSKFSDSSICVTLDLCRKSWQIQRAAFLWVFSSRYLWFDWWGSHMMDAYSRLDRTILMYANFFNSLGLPLRLRIKNPSFWLAVEATVEIWEAQDR